MTFSRPMIRCLAGPLLATWLAAGEPPKSSPPTPIELVYTPPTLLDWVQPVYPPEARKTRSEGKVLVELVVEADGRVSREKIQKSSDARFNEAALAAVRQWKFRPGLDEKESAAMAMVVPVVFELAQLDQKTKPLFPRENLMPSPMPTEPAHALGSMDPDYPDELEDRKLPGQVVMEFTVDDTGRARLPKVLSATHPAFVESALRMLERAKFEPAHQGPLPRVSRMQNPMEFVSLGARPADILGANHLEVIGGPPNSLPRLLMLIPPVYPSERLLAGESGSAEIEFSINEDGRPEMITVTSATAPEFGAALRAAAEAWAFQPAHSGQGSPAIRMKAVHAFAAETYPADNRLAQLVRPGGVGVRGPTGLDQKLKPLWRGYPVYPLELKERQLAGQAEVEFIIDRDGRVRLPRVLKASEAAFGWAAATAISQWVFERPIRAGEPADVMVRIPVDFKPPKAD